MSLNQVQLIGHLGGDPEVKKTRGDDVANFNIATSERWTDKSSGEKREKTQWHRVVAWGHFAGVAERMCRKGTKVFVQGRLETRDWEDRDGQKRTTTEVVLTGYRAILEVLKGGRERDDVDEREPSEPRGSQTRRTDYTGGGGGEARQDLDDEIPF